MKFLNDVACHMNFDRACGFLEQVKKILITKNQLEIPGEKTAYNQYFNHIKKIYFDKKPAFAKHLDHSEFLENSQYIRTNNYCEGYHRRLAQRIIYPRSRLTYVIHILQSEANYFEEKLVAHYRGQDNEDNSLRRDEVFLSFTKDIIKKYCNELESKGKGPTDLIKNPPNLPDLEDLIILNDETLSKIKSNENLNEAALINNVSNQDIIEDNDFYEDLERDNLINIEDEEDDNQVIKEENQTNSIREFSTSFSFGIHHQVLQASETNLRGPNVNLDAPLQRNLFDNALIPQRSIFSQPANKSSPNSKFPQKILQST